MRRPPSARPAEPRRRRPGLLPRLLCWLVALGPTGYLAWQGVGKLERDLDSVLREAAPLAEAEASAALGREVRIGGLSPDLSVRGLIRDFRRRAELGTITVAADDIRVANGPTLAGDGELAAARRVTAYVSVPRLLAGRTDQALTRVLVEGPRLLLVRDAKGRFNVQELVKPTEGPPKAPFVTRVEVEGGAVRFVDYAAKLPRLPQVNHLEAVNGFADLAERAIRFDASARPGRGTPTAATRLRGPVAAGGSLARGTPGELPTSPDPLTPRFRARLSVRDADGAYWAPYFLGPQDTFAIDRGRGDAELTLVGARPAAPDATPPPVAVQLSAAFRDATARFAFLRNEPLEAANGTLRFDDGVLSFDARARVLGQPAAAEGTLWNVGARPASAGGEPPPIGFSVAFDAPRIPLDRLPAQFDLELPKGVAVSGLGSAKGLVSGTPGDLVVSADARIPRVRLPGAPVLSDVAGRIALSRGVIGVTGLRARTGAGGTLAGRGAFRFARPVARPGAPPLPETERAGTFTVTARGVPLAEVDALSGLTGSDADSRLRLAGAADVDAAGSYNGATGVTGAANVTVRGLRLGDVPFSTAAARVVADRGSIAIPAARLVSPAGAVEVAGDQGSDGRLDLRFSALALDLGRLGPALLPADENGRRRPQVGGVVTATGRVTGTVKSPQLVADRVVGLNLRYENYAIDSVTARGVVATPDAVTLRQPVVLRRFPAEADVTGRITQLGLGAAGAPAGRGRPSPRPRLDLTVRVSDLDYNEVLRQVREAAPPAVAPTVGRGGATALVAAPSAEDAEEPALVAASVSRATVRVRGPVDDPAINGTALLGRLLVGPYPIDRGWVDFAYSGRELRLTEVSLAASVGIVRAKAVVAPDGQIRGQFAGTGLDLEPLSFLTREFAAVGGNVNLTGTFSGTQRRPVVTLSLNAPTVEVAGTPLSDVTATNLRYIANLGAERSRIEVPRFSFRQGDTRFSLSAGSYDVRTRRFSAAASVESADIGVLLGTLRRSGLSQTPAGLRFVQTLNSLPGPISGRFAVEQFRIAGRVGERGRIEDLNGAVVIGAGGLRLGQFVADTVAVRGGVIGDRIRLEDLTLVSGDTTIRAGGEVDLDGELRVTVDSNEFSLDLVRSFLAPDAQQNFPLRGTVSLTAVATGRTDAPRIAASLEGRDVRVLFPTRTGGSEDPAAAAAAAAAAAQVAATQQGAAAGEAEDPRGITLSLVRANAELLPAGQDGEGRRIGARIVVPPEGIVVTREGGGQITAEGTIPFSYEPVGIDPQGPIDFTVRIPDQALVPLVSVAGLRAVGEDAVVTAGTIGGQFSLRRSLAEPDLGGNLRITDAAFRFRRDERDLLNPITDFDVDLRLAGQDVVFDTFRAALGGPNRARGDFGSVSIGGRVTLTDLERLPGRLVRPEEGQPRRRAAGGSGDALGIRGRPDLVVRFDKTRVIEENLTRLLSPIDAGLGEAFRSSIDGSVAITGTLSRPVVATPRGRPIVLRDTRVQLPTEESEAERRSAGFPVNPSFNVAVEIDNRATLEGLGFLRFAFDVDGLATVGGSLSALDVRGSFVTLGGFLRYAFASFTVQKGGNIDLAYQGDSGRLQLENVIARATVYAPSGYTPSSSFNIGSDPASGNASRRLYNRQINQQPNLAGNDTRYRITARLNGRFPLGEAAGSTAEFLQPEFSSDPPLTQQQVIALIGTEAQIAALARGDVQSALQQGFQQALQSSILPGVVQPFETQIASLLGLEEFSLDYSLTGGAGTGLVLRKRLPEPFERFVLGYEQTFGRRSNTGQQQPFTVSLSYEFYELNFAKRFTPRLQLGLQTNEQRDHGGYLRTLFTY